ncbi:MAG: rhomboid family intramembrane serine protease, partial [Pyrinomonadaceae bacterium]
ACGQCGAPLVDSAGQSSARRSVYDGDAMRFARAVLSRPYTFTIIFLVVNLFIFLLMWSSSGLKNGPLMEFPYPVLIAYGAKLNRLVNAGQWWRLVTPIFIHINLIHLMVNMYSLWMVGPYVEKLYGSAKFVVFWVLTGVAGVVTSYLTVRPALTGNPLGRFLFKAGDGPSAGASGALFGLVGVLFVFGIKFRHELPEGFKRAFGTGLLPMIMLNLFIGYLGSGFIDNAAHLGGLASGAALALVVGYKRPGERAEVAVFWHVLQIAALALVAVSFLMVVRHFGETPPGLDQASASRLQRPDGSGNVERYLAAINQGQITVVSVVNGEDASGVEPSIKALSEAPRLSAQSDALRDELKSVLERARDYAALPQAERKKPKAQAQLNELATAFQTWQKNFGEWVKNEGQAYGLQIDEDTPAQDSSNGK